MTLGGGKRRKKAAHKNMGDRSKRPLLYKEDEQEYGLVEKMLGDMRCSVLCSDSTTKICHIRGKFKRRVWINVGDVVLVSLREFEDEKADVIHKYTADEAELLKIQEEFDPNALKNIVSGDGTSNIPQITNDVSMDNIEAEIDFDAL